MRITSGPALAAAVALSCFAAAAPSAAQTGPAETGRAALQTAGPLYTYGPPYRYAPYDQPRPWSGWGAYDTRNRDFSYRPWGPNLFYSSDRRLCQRACAADRSDGGRDWYF